jgi:FtsH-binding integral membrane protein
MALLLLATVFVGFAPTYYLAGVFRAPLPSPIIHVHGALFSCWVLLLVAQTMLVSSHRVHIHRRLGIAGFTLACVMVIVGVWAATDMLVRNGPPGRDARAFYAIPLSDMVIFATLIFFAFRARSNPTAHKRIILVATIALMIAAIARWPLAYVHRNAHHASLVSYIFVVMLVLYDLWSTHKIHRATVAAGAFLVFVQQIAGPIGRTAAWHAFAAWVQSAAR